MNELLHLITALAAGILLGGLFFGGLWWTVRRALVSKTPAIWFLTSMFLRTAIVLAGLYFVARGSWQRMAVCLLGFIIIRSIIVRQVGARKDLAHAS